jgi:thioredoxin reductase (NADPH)
VTGHQSVGRVASVSAGTEVAPQFLRLTDEQLVAVARRGTRHGTAAGEVLYRAGDRSFDFIVIEDGEVDAVRPAMPDAPEALIATWGPGQFLGELTC